MAHLPCWAFTVMLGGLVVFSGCCGVAEVGSDQKWVKLRIERPCNQCGCLFVVC